jgi:hypothetical protein
MPSIRLPGVPLLIVAALQLAGCGTSQNAGWPSGTEAIVSAPENQVVIAIVPTDQQNKISRDSLMLGSQTPVVIVHDPVLRTTPAGTIGRKSPSDRVRVRVLRGRQRIDVLVRRRELAPGTAAGALYIHFMPAAVLLLFAVAGMLWTFETVVLSFLRIRSDRTDLHLGPLPLQTLATVVRQNRKRSRTIERTDEECERWREWIAEKTSRRKAACGRLRAHRLQERAKAATHQK